MSLAVADRLTRAVMYEGYLLYPYTPSAIKNRQRWTFGALYPHRYIESRPGADSHQLQCQCLVEVPDRAEIVVRIRFLHLVLCTSPEDGEWEEALEREEMVPLQLENAINFPVAIDFSSPAGEEVSSGVRRIRHALVGRVETSCERLRENLFRLTVRVVNRSEHEPATRNEALLHSMVATHLVLSVAEAKFISMIDPPEDCKEHAEQCRNSGTWPVLLGNPGETTHVLAAPIILYDYPRVAPESPGDLFDGGEIDEILSLRILTLTDEEKEQIRKADPIGRAMLERTERLSPEDLLRLHGTWRTDDRAGGPELHPGTRVRIRPKKCNDAFDVILSGKTATVEKIEEDLEGDFHVVVSLDDDPGRDLDMKAQLGHRFFYRPEDLERL